MKSKTIIISALEENNTRGILTVFQDDELLKCRLRVYNLEKISRYCKLGIYHENEVYSANLLEKNGVYESSFVGDFDIDKDFYVALIDTSKNNEVLLAGGTYQGFYFNDNSVFLNSENFSKPNQIKQQTQSNISENSNCETDCDKCAKCKYKEFFYSQQQNENENDEMNKVSDLQEKNITSQEILQTEQSEEKCESVEKERVVDVINSIIPQFDTLFEQYEQDLELNSLIENSKFVKICENGEQFSIGAIYENAEIKFICYAIKRDYNINPPKELGENYQWLPIDIEDPLSVGYFVVFQDASDLKIIKI